MPKLTQQDAKVRLAGERVARMATVGEDGAPHVVVHTFATEGDWIFHAVDHKPKTTAALKRLANIRANPRVSVLADHYSDEWEELWWVRADGVAHIFEPGAGRQAEDALRLLAEKYVQYREHPPEGPVIAVEVRRWSGWSYSQPGVGGGGASHSIS